MKTVSIHNLHEVTAQEVFDHIARHMLIQGVKSWNTRGKCLYRHNGLMCAAGCLFPVEGDVAPYEGDPWAILVNEGKVPSYHCRLIQSLQSVHDAVIEGLWPDELKVVASQFNLDCSVVDRFLRGELK